MTPPAFQSHERFYGPAVFKNVFDRFDVGAGDRFYGHPDAYRGRWGDARPNVQSSLYVTYASRGELGTIHFVVERPVADSDRWAQSGVTITTQRDFQLLIDLLPNGER